MDEIVRANLSVYADGAEVARYLAAPYHARRITDASALLLRETQRRVRQPLIADLGAGTSAVSTLLRERGAQVVAVDMGLPPARPGSSGTAIVRADVSRPLPFRPASFDGVFAGEIIEHLFEPIEFLRECRRVLAPGGAIVVTTPNLATLQDRVRFLLGRSPRQVDPQHPYLKLHIRQFTYSSLTRAFEACGFTPVSFRSNYVVVGNDRHAVSSRLLARVFPSVGGSLILAGLKAWRDSDQAAEVSPNPPS